MKNENDLFESNNEKRDIPLNGKPLKVTGVEPLYMVEEAIERAKLLGLLAIVTGLISLGLNITNIVMHQTDDYMGTEYYKYQTAEPVEETQYTAPAGYALEYRNGEAYAVKHVIRTESGTNETKATTEVRRADTVTTYSAPEGYILIGDKCYKIVEPEEKAKGR